MTRRTFSPEFLSMAHYLRNVIMNGCAIYLLSEKRWVCIVVCVCVWVLVYGRWRGGKRTGLALVPGDKVRALRRFLKPTLASWLPVLISGILHWWNEPLDLSNTHIFTRKIRNIYFSGSNLHINNSEIKELLKTKGSKAKTVFSQISRFYLICFEDL